MLNSTQTTGWQDWLINWLIDWLIGIWLIDENFLSPLHSFDCNVGTCITPWCLSKDCDSTYFATITLPPHSPQILFLPRSNWIITKVHVGKLTGSLPELLNLKRGTCLHKGTLKFLHNYKKWFFEFDHFNVKFSIKLPLVINTRIGKLYSYYFGLYFSIKWFFDYLV